MNVRWLVLGVALLSFGTACASTCSGFKSASGNLAQAAPGGTFMVTITGCSTCAHAHSQVLWTAPKSGVTGTVEVQIFPGCFVQPVVDNRPATPGVGDYSDDFNVANCGDNIDYTGQATNKTNVTFSDFELHLDCTPFKAAM